MALSQVCVCGVLRKRTLACQVVVLPNVVIQNVGNVVDGEQIFRWNIVKQVLWGDVLRVGGIDVTYTQNCQLRPCVVDRPIAVRILERGTVNTCDFGVRFCSIYLLGPANNLKKSPTIPNFLEPLSLAETSLNPSGFSPLLFQDLRLVHTTLRICCDLW